MQPSAARRAAHAVRSSTLATRVRRRWFWLRHDAAAESVTVTTGGLRLSLPTRFAHHYAIEDYEPLTRRVFADALAPGMTVADVGAHVGYYTILAARRVGPAGTVHAVEPCAETLAFLERNLALNEVTNVVVHPYAAGAARRNRVLHVTGSSDSHGFYPHPLTETLRTVEVAETPLSEVLDGRVDVVKIDVEGAEIEVLDGMREALLEAPPRSLLVEWNPACMTSAGRDPLELPAHLERLGFATVVALDDRELRVRTLAETRRIVSGGPLPPSWHVNLWARRD